MSSMRIWLARPWLVGVIAVTMLGGAGIWLGRSRQKGSFVQRATLGDLEVIHSRVLVRGVQQQGRTRLADGDRVTTELAGRAELRLSNGVVVLLDGSTEIGIGQERVELIRGRLFVDSPEGKKLEVVVGPMIAPLSASKVAFERAQSGSSTKIFCAQGEVMVSGAGAATPTRVPSGETLSSSDGKTTVQPEKAFDDWTGGLAVPWETQPLGRSALADVWATTDQGEPLTPLHVSSQSVEVELKDEFALTRTRTRYYNGNDRSVTPTVRLALPPNAILTRVAHQRSTDAQAISAQLATCRQELSNDVGFARLEWAGNGWISGLLPEVGAGASIDLELDYGEWLSASSGVARYRYPLGRGEQSPLVGELSIRIDAEASHASHVNANQGATIEGKKLSWRAADIKPSDDWEVGFVSPVAVPNVARAYVESDPNGGDPYLVIRAETEPRTAAGVELAIVVDSSRSVGFAGLELSRQIVEALLGDLSDKDSVVVFAADEQPREIGPAVPSFNTPQLRTTIATKLSEVRPGGASHLERAIERAADALDYADHPASSRMVVVLGDGRASLGELTADPIRARLGRRSSGIPRMAAIAVGASADRWLLARLVAGSGPVFSALDRAEAARVAASIVSAAEVATLRDVKFDLGPNIDRIYPREGLAIAAGTTATVVGRLRGTLPKTVQLAYRDGSGTKTTALAIERFNSPSEGEVARRWALARIDEIVAGSEGIEPALLLARQHRLLLPWTEWVLESSQQGERATCSTFSRRIVELSTLNDTPYARRIEPPPAPGSGWLEPPLRYDPGASLEQGAIASAATRIKDAMASFVACRDSRLPVIPNLPSEITYQVALSGTGRADRVSLTPRDARPDSLFLGCVHRSIESLPFVGADRPVTVNGLIRLPPPKDPKRSHCSVASRLPLPIRRSIWTSRTGNELLRYEAALHGCEISTWAERRELLLLFVAQSLSAAELVQLSETFADRGHTDTGNFLRNEALQRIASLDELKQLQGLVLTSEPNLDADIAARVRRATTNQQRLDVITRALTMAPHSPLGRRLALLLLERMGQNGALQREVEAIRRDPFTDAGLISMAATVLRRSGQAEEARRCFSELFERAPKDPWILAFAGDKLRVEGFADQAIEAYESLERATPNDTANLLRMGLAQAAAGRVDIASRLLDRAAQTAGRSDDQRLNELAAVVRAVILGRAQAMANSAEEQLELARRLAQTALPDVAALILVEAPTDLEQGLTVQAYRGDQKAPSPPDLDAPALGLSALYVDRNAQTNNGHATNAQAANAASSVKVELSRRTLAGLERPLQITLSILALGDNPYERRLRSMTAEIAADQEKATVTLNAELRP